ncbi:MAG: lysophospholipid acyltransferase family protein [Desulfovibrionales bacterium]
MAIKLDPAIVSPPLCILTRLWCMSLRYERTGYELLLHERSRGKRLVYATWHDELFPLGFLHRGEGVVAVVSQSRDGEFIGRVLAHFGFVLARGSSSRGGLKALVSAFRTMKKENRSACFTVDGPRGPRHKVKDGAIFLAVKSNALLVPVRVSMSPVKVFERSWDKFQLPLPGAKCRVTYGVPYHPDDDLSPEGLQRQRAILEERLNSLGGT